MLEKFSAVRMLDARLPITHDRDLVLPRYTEPDEGLQLLLMRVKLALPNQPPLVKGGVNTPPAKSRLLPWFVRMTHGILQRIQQRPGVLQIRPAS